MVSEKSRQTPEDFEALCDDLIHRNRQLKQDLLSRLGDLSDIPDWELKHRVRLCDWWIGIWSRRKAMSVAFGIVPTPEEIARVNKEAEELS